MKVSQCFASQIMDLINRFIQILCFSIDLHNLSIRKSEDCAAKIHISTLMMR